MSAEMTVDEFLKSSDEEIRAIALAARALVLDVFPDAIEQIDVPARLLGYGYNRGYSGLVCTIAIQKGYVNLMFSKGTTLPDPHKLLEGTGKYARHIKLRKLEDLEKPGVRALVETAVAEMNPNA